MKWESHDWRAALDREQWVYAEDRERLKALLRGRTVRLASISPRRREILTQCGVRYRMAKQTVKEPPPQGPDWRGWVRRWAMRKAASGAERVSGGVVMAADTIVVLRDRGLGKPRDLQQAAAMLRSLSGRTHQVYTGVAVINVTSSRRAAGSAVSDVRFRRLSKAVIARYVRGGEPTDKAGAYAIQGAGGQLVNHIVGPLDNIIGLPVGCLSALLERVLP